MTSKSGPKAASADAADQPGEPALQAERFNRDLAAHFIQAVGQIWPEASVKRCTLKRLRYCAKCDRSDDWRLFHTCDRR